MKKYVIALCVAGVALAFYFMCGSSNKNDESKNALLTNSANGQAGPAGPGTGGQTTYESADDSTSDTRRDEGRPFGSDDVKPAVDDTVSFSLQGDQKTYTYKSIASFRKIAISQDLTGYVTNFVGNMSSVNVADQNTYSHVVSLMVPVDITPGTLNEKTSSFMFQFFGSENGVNYTLDPNCSFTLTIDEWGGPGGRAKGTFSGELKAAEGTNVISMRDGRFNVSIQ